MFAIFLFFFFLFEELNSKHLSRVNSTSENITQLYKSVEYPHTLQSYNGETTHRALNVFKNLLL